MSTENTNPDRTPAPKRAHIIGILGGIGSGKSTVTSMFAELGAGIFDADKVSHKLLQEKEIKKKIAQEFGPSVLDTNGEIQRSELGKVFQNPAEVSRLTALLHPPILLRMKEAVENVRATGQPRVLVLDVPLLVETGSQDLADILVFVDTPRPIRLARLKERSGLDEKEVSRREKLQTSINFKSEIADYKVDCSKTREETFRQVLSIWTKVLGESG